MLPSHFYSSSIFRMAHRGHEVQPPTDWTKKNRREEKGIYGTKEIAANCHHSNRVGEGSRVRSGGLFCVFSAGAKLARGPTELARVALAPIDLSPSWTDTLPEIASVSNSASRKRLLVSCCRWINCRNTASGWVNTQCCAQAALMQKLCIKKDSSFSKR